MSSYRPTPPRRPGPPPPPYAQQYGRPPGAGVTPQRTVPKHLIIAIAVVVAVVISALIAGLKSGKKPRGGGQAESLQEKYKDTAEAFSASVGTETEETEAIKKALADFAKAIKEQDLNKAADCFDTQRMLKEMQNAGLLTNMSRRDEAGFGMGIKMGLRQALSNPAHPLAAARLDVKRVKLLSDKTEAVVYLRAHHANVGRIKYRWWVKKGQGNQWRIYDLEDLDGGIRMSDAMGMAVGSGGGTPGVAPWVKDAPKLQMTFQALAAKDIDSAEETIKELEGVNFPGKIQALVVMCKGILAIGKAQPDEALKLFDHAQSMHGDLPALNYMRALAYNVKGEHEKALASAKKYVELLGDDADVYQAIGEALEGLEREEEALAAYRKGHDDDPSVAENLAAIARLLPEGAAGHKELGDRFAKTIKDSADKGETFASIAVEIEDGDALEAVVAAYKKDGGKGFGVSFHEARAKLLKEEYEKAYQLLQPLVKKAPEDDKEEVMDMLVEAAVGVGKWKEAYESLPDPVDAMERVGSSLLEMEKGKELKVLAELHRQKSPDDPNGPYYAGEALKMEGSHDKAAEQFAAALKNAREEAKRNAILYELVQARHKSGKGLATHAEAAHADKPMVFWYLTSLMAGDKDAANLTKLIEAQRTQVGETPALDWAKAQVHWIKGEYAPMVEVLTRSRDGIIRQSQFAETQVDDLLIRGLVRQKKFAEARAVLQKQGEDADPLYQTIVDVCSLDPAAAPKAVAQFVKDDPSGMALRRLYNDPDAGPALRSPDLFSLRVKYPEPTPGTKPSATRPAK